MLQEMTDSQLKAYKIISQRLKQIDRHIDHLEDEPQTKTVKKQLRVWRELHSINCQTMKVLCGQTFLIQ